MSQDSLLRKNKSPSRPELTEGGGGEYHARASSQRACRFGDLLAIAALSAAIFFFHLGSYGFWETDESRYAEVAREMLVLHDWIVPHLDYFAYVYKPPLLFWLVAISFRAFGANEWAARLVSAVPAFGCVALTYLFAARTLGRRRALLGSAILTTFPLYAIMAQVLTMDMLLTLMVSLALFTCYLHWLDGARWTWWSFYVAMALAMLAKGPVGALLPLLTAAIFFLWQGQLAAACRRLRPWLGLALTGVLALPWFIAVAIREPGFLQFYFIGEHLQRFFAPNYAHPRPLYYFVPVVLAGTLPWCLFVPFFRRPSEVNAVRRFLVTAVATTIGLFSLSRGKLIPYVLPAFPPLALLIADGILSVLESAEVRADRTAVRKLAWIGVPLGAAGIAAAIVSCSLFAGGPLMPSVLAIGLALCVGAPLFAAYIGSLPDLALGILTLTVTVSLIAGSYSRVALSATRSYSAFARKLSVLQPNATMICYHRFLETVPFFTGRRILYIGDPGEHLFGIQHSRDASRYVYGADADLVRLWNRSRSTVLLIDQHDLDRLAPSLGAFKVVAEQRDTRAVVIEGGAKAQ